MVIRREKGCGETRALSGVRGSGYLYVGRPSVAGNPFGLEHGRAECIAMFKAYWFAEAQSAKRDEFLRAARHAWNKNAGLTLLCWCGHAEACHADVLVEWLKSLAQK